VAGDRWARSEQWYRIAIRVWTLVVIAGDLALFIALSAWDTSGAIGSQTAVFIALQILVGFAWFLGYQMIRSLFFTD
jgi:F0F1-type ATP synthase assembly protein I